MRKFKQTALLLTVLLSQSAYADTTAKYISGDCVNGQGTYTWSDGKEKTGTWKSNQYAGQLLISS